eukprot:SAG31_NODE_1742_length_7385_cov_40.678836_10_plen_44_part_01
MLIPSEAWELDIGMFAVQGTSSINLKYFHFPELFSGMCLPIRST